MQFFFKKKKKNSVEIFKALGKACEGLVYISETDAPVIPYRGPKVDRSIKESLVAAVGAQSKGTAVEDDPERFFARLTAEKAWFGPAEIKTAKKFQMLKRILTEDLRDLKVVRFGSIRIDIYVVGIDSDGTIMGISTKAVET